MVLPTRKHSNRLPRTNPRQIPNHRFAERTSDPLHSEPESRNAVPNVSFFFSPLVSFSPFLSFCCFFLVVRSPPVYALILMTHLWGIARAEPLGAAAATVAAEATTPTNDSEIYWPQLGVASPPHFSPLPPTGFVREGVGAPASSSPTTVRSPPPLVEWSIYLTIPSQHGDWSNTNTRRRSSPELLAAVQRLLTARP